MDSLISVIVPCYNTGNYIGRCLDSILASTYKNLEIIVVDDGSTDSSAKVVQGFMKKDNRVKYIYQPNSGVSAARNKGIDGASGELITFVDSDDTIVPEMYQVLTDLMEQYDADISHCSYSRDYGTGMKAIGDTKRIYKFENDDIVKSLLGGRLISPSSCNKLFKKEVIGEIRFNAKVKHNEDLLFDFEVFQRAEKAVFIDSCLYVYHVEDTSSCNKTDRIKKSEDCYQVSRLIYEKSNGRSYKDLSFQRVIMCEIGLYLACAYKKPIDKEKIADIRNRVRTTYRQAHLTGNAKRKAFLIAYFPHIFKLLYSIYDRIRKPNWDL